MRTKDLEEDLDDAVRAVLDAAWVWSAGSPTDKKNGDKLRAAVARWTKAASAADAMTAEVRAD